MYVPNLGNLEINQTERYWTLLFKYCMKEILLLKTGLAL